MATRPSLFIYVTLREKARIQKAAEKAGFRFVNEYVRQVLKKDIDKQLARD